MIPVVLITGFLGSGKTTLLNRILAAGSPVDGKLAVIVNELGDAGIDGDLLPAGMTRQVELPGGCICCVLDEDLEKTIMELTDVDSGVAMIVVETTGIAEPLPIGWTLEAEPLSERVRLAAVITVVDSLEHERHRPMSPSVDAQVEDADVLVLSKGDVPEAREQIPGLVAALRRQNETAPILTGEPDEVVAQLTAILVDPPVRPGAATAPAHRHGSHGVESISLPIGGVLDLEELADRLQELPRDVLRIKGIADVLDEGAGWLEPTRVAFHRVGARVSAEPIAGGGEPRMVAIGYHLDRDALAACIEDAAIPGD
jgi:G3E family GTPase